MIGEGDFLKYGALGFGALILFLMLWLIVRPLVLAGVKEVRDNRVGLVAALEADRKERADQREQFLGFMENHAEGQVEALHEVRDGLREEVAGLREVRGGLAEVTNALRKLNGRREREED